MRAARRRSSSARTTPVRAGDVRVEFARLHIARAEERNGGDPATQGPVKGRGEARAFLADEHQVLCLHVEAHVRAGKAGEKRGEASVPRSNAALVRPNEVCEGKSLGSIRVPVCVDPQDSCGHFRVLELVVLARDMLSGDDSVFARAFVDLNDLVAGETCNAGSLCDGVQRVPLFNRRGHGKRGWLEMSGTFEESVQPLRAAERETVLLRLYAGGIRARAAGNMKLTLVSLDDQEPRSRAESAVLEAPGANQERAREWWGSLLQVRACRCGSVRLSIDGEANHSDEGALALEMSELVARSGTWVALGANYSVWIVVDLLSVHAQRPLSVDSSHTLGVNLSWASPRAGGKFYAVAHLFPAGLTRGRAKYRDVVRSLTHDTQTWKDELRLPVSSVPHDCSEDAALFFAFFEETPTGTELQGCGRLAVPQLLSETKLGKQSLLLLQHSRLEATVHISGAVLAPDQACCSEERSNNREFTAEDVEVLEIGVRTQFLHDTELPKTLASAQPGAIRLEVELARDDCADDHELVTAQEYGAVEIVSGDWRSKALVMKKATKESFAIPQQWSDRQRVVPTLRFVMTSGSRRRVESLDIAALCMWPHEGVQVRMGLGDLREAAAVSENHALIVKASFNKAKRPWSRAFPGGKIHVHVRKVINASSRASFDSAQVQMRLRGAETMGGTVVICKDESRSESSDAWDGHAILRCGRSADTPVVEYEVRDAGGKLVAEAHVALPPSVCLDGHVMNAEIPLRSPGGDDVKVAKLVARVEVFPDLAFDSDGRVALRVRALALEPLSLGRYKWAGRTALSLRFSCAASGAQWQTAAVEHEDRERPSWNLLQELPSGQYEVIVCNDAALPDSESYKVASSSALVALSPDEDVHVKLPGLGVLLVRAHVWGAEPLSSPCVSGRTTSSARSSVSAASIGERSSTEMAFSRSSTMRQVVRWAVLSVRELEGPLHRAENDEFFRVSGETIASRTTPRGELGARVRISLDNATTSLRLTLCRDDAHALENEIGRADLPLSQVGDKMAFSTELLHCVTQAAVGIVVSGDLQVFVRDMAAEAAPADLRAEVEQCLKACRLKAIFYRIDKDRSETVSREEFLAALQEDTELVAGLGKAASQPEKLFAKLDRDGNGDLTWSEFQRLVDLVSRGDNLVDGDEEDVSDAAAEGESRHGCGDHETADEEIHANGAGDMAAVSGAAECSSPERSALQRKARRARPPRSKRGPSRPTAAVGSSKPSPRKPRPAKKGSRRASSGLQRTRSEVADSFPRARARKSREDYAEVEAGDPTWRGDEFAPPAVDDDADADADADAAGAGVDAGLLVRVRELERALEVQQELHAQEKKSLEADTERVREELEHTRERVETLDEANARRAKELEMEKRRSRDLHKNMSDAVAELVSYRKLGEEGFDEEQWRLIRLHAISKEQDRRLERAREEREIQGRAAAKLQALARSARARIAYRKEREARTSAAVALQAAARVRIAQKWYAQHREEAVEGCRRLQAVARGRTARRRLSSVIRAATRIQAAFRARRGRQAARKRAVEQASARAIQAQARRRRSMREFETLKKSHLERVRAAVLIQKRIRGLHAREAFALRVDERRQQELEHRSAASIQKISRSRSARREYAGALARRDAAIRAACLVQHWFFRRRVQREDAVDSMVRRARRGGVAADNGSRSAPLKRTASVPQDARAYLRLYVKSRGGLSGTSAQQARDTVARAVISLGSEDAEGRDMGSLAALADAAPALVETAMARRREAGAVAARRDQT